MCSKNDVRTEKLFIDCKYISGILPSNKFCAPKRRRQMRHDMQLSDTSSLTGNQRCLDSLQCILLQRLPLLLANRALLGALLRLLRISVRLLGSQLLLVEKLLFPLIPLPLALGGLALCSVGDGGPVWCVEDLLLVYPQFVGEPDWQRFCGGTLDVKGADVAPALLNVLGNERGDNGGGVLGELLGCHGEQANLDRGVGRGAHAEVCRVQCALDLLGGALWGSNDVLWLLCVLLRALVDVRTGSKADRNWALGLALVEGLAEEFGNDLDDAVVDQEDVVLGKECALLLVGLVSLPQLVDAKDALDLGAERGREGIGGDEILVGSLRVLGEHAYPYIVGNDGMW